MTAQNKTAKTTALLPKRRLAKLIPFAFYGLLIVFLILYIRSIDFAKLSDLQITWIYLAPATLFALAFRYLGAFTWLQILKGLGAKELHHKGGLIYVYAKSWLGRYIPGTAPWILSKIYFASQHGLSKQKLAISSLLEAGLQIIVVLVISAVMLALDPRLGVLSDTYKLIIAFTIALGSLALLPPVFNAFARFVYHILKKKALPAEHHATSRVVAQGSLLYGLGAIFNGLVVFFVAKAVYAELDPGNALFIMSAANLAGAVGMLAVFAPSGIGVREGVLLLLLGLVMPAEAALATVVLARLWDVLADFAFFGISTLFKHKKFS